MDRLESMAILVMVAEAGSLSAAARRLDIPLTTVSRKIAELERSLKARLLTRSSRRITLTDAGTSYVAACKRILEDVGEAERTAAGEYRVPKGELNITAPIVLGRLHLVPVLSDFLQAYPDITVRLVLVDRLVNLTEEAIDIAMRLGDLADSALLAARIGTVHRVLAASPNYLKMRGTPKKPTDLVDYDCIGVQGFIGPGFWSVGGDVLLPIRYRLTVNSTDAACDAAKAGLGIVSVFSHHVTSAFRDGALVPVLTDYERRTVPVSLVRASEDYLPLKLRTFMDFATPRLKARLSAAQDEFLATRVKS